MLPFGAPTEKSCQEPNKDVENTQTCDAHVILRNTHCKSQAHATQKNRWHLQNANQKPKSQTRVHLLNRS